MPFIELRGLGFTVLLYKGLKRAIRKRFSYQRRFIDFNIKKNELVLDIGSGADAFPLATHLADLYLEETSHRPGGGAVKKDARPFVICDIQQTPFKDNAFDFVYCSHLLEHVDNPAEACEELMRIGKRGYIETPTRMSDILFNFTRLKNHHTWHIVLVDHTLVFISWRKDERHDLHFSYFFNQVNSEDPNLFQSFFYRYMDLFRNMFLWEKEFNYIIIDKDGSVTQRAKKKETQ